MQACIKPLAGGTIRLLPPSPRALEKETAERRSLSIFVNRHFGNGKLGGGVACIFFYLLILFYCILFYEN